MPASPEYRARLARVPPFAFRPPAPPDIPPIVAAPPPASPPDPWEPTVLGTDEYGIPVAITAKDRCEHTLVLGKTGQGKSNMLRHLIDQDVRAGRGCCVIDPHGKLIDDVLGAIPRWREDDVVYLDAADDEFPFGLNFFQSPRGATPRERAQLIDQILQAFEKGWGGGWAGSAETWLKVCSWTFMENRTGTMAMIPRLLTDRDYRAAFLPRIRDPFTAQKWRAAINAKTGELKAEGIEPILTRLYKFLGNPLIANIVGQERTTLDFDGWMAESKIVLIKLPEGGRYGIGKEAVGLLGTMILQLIVQAGYGREEGSALFPIYCDECHHYVTSDIPEILQNLRKYGVGISLATQSFANIADAAIRERLLGAGSVICYQVAEQDARVVAGAFREGMRVGEDWREEVTRHAIGRDRYETRAMVYHRPSKAEIADRLANLRTLAGVGRSLVRTNDGEYVVRTRDMDRDPRDGHPRANRAYIVRQSRTRYCRPRFAVERAVRRALLPDEGDGDAGGVDAAVPALPPPPHPPATRRRERLSADDGRVP